MIPSMLPYFDQNELNIFDGSEIHLNEFCKKSFKNDAKCLGHYTSLLASKVGYYLCPFGFTSRKFELEQRAIITTGVVAFPRFDVPDERRMAKNHPHHKASRESIERFGQFLNSLENLRADKIEEASKVLPHAFHELRKLNGAVIQHAEKEILERGETRSLLSIKAAAELMRNNFDILEALSNIDGIKSLPIDSTINVFDLFFKMKRVFQEKAAARDISINISGDKPIIGGSQKSFPIVPAVLLENAIKYGEKGSLIKAQLTGANGLAKIVVENQSNRSINPTSCFDRGVRFSTDVEGGGFGLFLAREVVRCHGGTIQCEIEDNIIRMVVELPLRTTVPHSRQGDRW